MAKMPFQCARCGTAAERDTGDYNRKVKAGAPMHCSRACAWAARRERAAKEAAARAKPCETCGTVFSPRAAQLRNGDGRYCSQKCNKAFHLGGQRPEVWEARKQTMREMRERGEWTFRRGAEQPNWKGGAKARTRRLIESGVAAERVREYRRKNPDKVREFAKRRKDRTHGTLPYGTIPKIRERQKNRCAICTCSLKNGDHLDHIVPLARGGKHEPSNLQLLCPPCNLAKSSRDPIEHMQSLGRLL